MGKASDLGLLGPRIGSKLTYRMQHGISRQVPKDTLAFSPQHGTARPMIANAQSDGTHKCDALSQDGTIGRHSLVYEREILVKLCRRDSPFITEKAIYEFRDIYDHLATFFEVIEICRELIARIMEIHLSMIDNQMVVVANRTNA
jgi:Mg2+ and Co2+ transporter CorA